MFAFISILVLSSTVSSVSATCRFIEQGNLFILSETDPPGTRVFAATKEKTDSVSFTVTDKPASGNNLFNTLQQSFRVNNINDTFFIFENNKTLDLEEFYYDYKQVVNLINLTISCGGSQTQINVAVNPVNNFNPIFNGAPYNTSISESMKAGETVYTLKDKVTDQDVGMTQNFFFAIVPYKITKLDGRDKFSIPTATLGAINLVAPLDFDNGGQHAYMLNLSVSDGLHTTYTTLTISLEDADDQPPYFSFPGCSGHCEAPPFESLTRLVYTGPLTVTPIKLTGMDDDTLGAPLKFGIASGNGYGLFAMNEDTAEVTQLRSVNDAHLPDPQFRLVIQVYKRDYPFLKSIAILTVKVYERMPNDTGVSPPPSGVSTSNDSVGISLLIPLIILGVLLFLVIGALIAVFILYRRKQRKMTVGPSDDKSEPQTEEEELEADEYNSKGFSNEKLVFGNKTTLGIMTDEFPPTPTERANTLPPLPLKDSATETMEQTKKKRSRRRNKNKEPEIFDGTREYNMGMDPEFFEATDKSKVKRSQRSRKADSSQPINVTNDQGDVDSGYF